MKILWSESFTGPRYFDEGTAWWSGKPHVYGGYNGRTWWEYEIADLLRKVMP